MLERTAIAGPRRRPETRESCTVNAELSIALMHHRPLCNIYAPVVIRRRLDWKSPIALTWFSE